MNSQHSDLLVFGPHPDDIEFGCGGIIAGETSAGRKAHFVVCSLGEAGTNGTPEQREKEAREAAKILGATIEFIVLDGDAHLEISVQHTLKLAEVIRRIQPRCVLAPTVVQNQHPDHARLGQMARDAARLARYGGIEELRALKPHTIESLFFYAISADAEPRDITPILIDISLGEIVSKWAAAMNTHLSQTSTRNYVEMQLARAKLLGARAGVEFAAALYPNDPLIFESLAHAGKGARKF